MTPALTNALAALASRLTASGDYEAVDVIDTATARIARLEEALRLLIGSIDAAYIEGWIEALAEGDIERIRDLWHRRISYHENDARAALGSDAV